MPDFNVYINKEGAYKKVPVGRENEFLSKYPGSRQATKEEISIYDRNRYAGGVLGASAAVTSTQGESNAQEQTSNNAQETPPQQPNNGTIGGFTTFKDGTSGFTPEMKIPNVKLQQSKIDISSPGKKTEAIAPFGNGRPLTESIGNTMKSIPISPKAQFDISQSTYKQEKDWIKEVENDPSISPEVKKVLIEDYNKNIRISDNSIDVKDLPLYAKQWLKDNEVDVPTSMYVQGSSMFGGGKYVEGTKKANTPEQISFIKDFIANTPQGQDLVKRQNEYVNYLENSISEVESRIPDLKKKYWQDLNDLSSSHPYTTGNTQGKSETDAAREDYINKSKELAKRMSALSLAEKNAEDQKKLLSAIKDGDLNVLSQFGKQIGRDFGEMAGDIGTLGIRPMMQSLYELKDVKELQRRIDNKEPISEEDRLAMFAMANNQAYQELMGDKRTISQEVASGITQSAPFMITFATTGGVGKSVTGGVKELLKQGIKRNALNAIRSGAEASIEKIGARLAGFGLNVADATARASVMAAISPQTYRDMFDNMRGNVTYGYDKDGKPYYLGNVEQMDITKALLNAWGSNTIENVSEFSGFGMEKGQATLSRLLKQRVPEVSKVLSLGSARNEFFQGVNKAMEQAGFNGTVNEYLEEQVATVLHSFFEDGQAQWSDLVDPRQQFITFLTVASIGSGSAILNTSGNHLMKYGAKKAYNNAFQDFGTEFYNSQNNDIAGIFADKMRNGTIEEKQSALSNIVDSDLFNDKQKLAALNLYRSGLTFESYEGSKQAQIDESIKEIPAIIEENVNPKMGSVIHAIIAGMDTPVQIADGNILQNEDGSIDREKSDQEIYYTDSDGKRQVASIRNVENITENIPAQDAIDQVTEQVATTIIAQQENEEVRPYQAGETVRFSPDGNTSLIGQISGQDQTTGNYLLSLETPNGIQQMQVEPRQIINEDNLQGVENGSPVIYTNQNGKQIKDVVATTPDLYLQGLIGFENGDVVPISNVIGLAQNSETGIPVSEQNTNNVQPISQKNEDITLPQQSNVKVNESRVFEIGDGLSATENKDGTYSIDKQFPKSELKKADNLINKLNEDYSDNGLVFELVQLPKQDASNPFEKPLWGVVARLQQEVPTTQTETSPQNRENEHLWNIAENSDNPIEISSAYNQAMQSAGEEILQEWQKQLLGKKINKSSFERFGDRNYINGTIARSWFNRKGEETPLGTIDVVAQELGVTEQDIIDFIINHPSNRIKKGNELTQALNDKFKQIAQEVTGREVGGIESNSGKLFLSTLEYAANNTPTEIEVEFMQSDVITNIPSSVEFFLSDYMNLDEISDFNQFRDAVEEADKQGYFMFPLEPKDKEVILNYINNAERQANAVQGIGEDVSSQQIPENVEAESEVENPHDVFLRKLTEVFPDSIKLYHRTTPENWKSIKKDGFIRMSEHNDGANIGVHTVMEDPNQQRVGYDNSILLEINVPVESYNKLYPEEATYYEDLSDDDSVKFDNYDMTFDTYMKAHPDFRGGDIVYSEDIPLDMVSVYNPTSSESKEKAEHIDVAIPEYNGNIVEYIKAVGKNVEVSKAESATNTNPTEAQKEAGNYKKGKVTIQGLDISIEQPRGSVRSGTDQNGKEWSIEMQNTYGYIGKTKSRDGDHIDVFLGNNPESKTVFVVDQINQDQSFDEHKVMLGFDSIEQAREAYLSNYEEGWQGLGNITQTDIDTFKKWAKTDGRRIKPFADYKSIQSQSIGNNQQSSSNIFKPINDETFNSLVDRLKQTGLARDVVTDKAAFDAKLNEVINDNATAKQVLSEMDTIKQKAIANGTFMRTNMGDVYGFVTPDGTVYLDSTRMNANTPIHEFGHLWNSFIKENNTDLYNRGAELIKESEYWQRVNDNPSYHNLSDEAKVDEALAMAIGDKGEAIVNEKGLGLKLRRWIREVWNWIGEQLGIRNLNSEQIQNLTLEQFTEGAISDILNGKRLKQSKVKKIVEESLNNGISQGISNLEISDEAYFNAIEKGDLEKARAIIDAFALKNGYINESDYRMSHRSPSADNNPSENKIEDGGDFSLMEIAQGYSSQPSDYFDDPRGYMYDDTSGMESRAALMSAMRAIRSHGDNISNMPTVTVYRAVPKSLKEGSIRNGDWVTPSQSYAKIHGNNALNGNYRIISEEIPANNLWWDGNDIREWGVDDNTNYVYKDTKNNKKIIDVITYDNNKNIIPPSKRFNEDKKDTRYQFVGKQGAENLDKVEEATIRIDNLQVAREMENANKDAKSIKLATGWERGADGKWRYEIPDSQTTQKFKDLDIGESISLEEALVDKKLFIAYPDLKDVNVEIVDTRLEGGSWNPSYKTIELSAYLPAYKNGKFQSDEIFDVNAIDEGFRNVLIHEIQHAIQDIEGFARGGSISSSEIGLSRMNDFLEKYPEFYEYNKSVLAMSEDESDMSALNKAIELSSNLDEKLMSEYNKLLINTIGISEYKRLAGEVEARNVQSRMNMTLDERINSLAEETEDVARKDQIFINNALNNNQELRYLSIPINSVNELADATNSTMSENMRNELDKKIKNLWFRIREAWEDRHLAVKEFLDLLRENGTEVADHNDFYKKVTHVNGAIDAQLEIYNNNYQKPLNKAISELEKVGFNYRDIENYAILKHGLERNAWMKQGAINQYMANNPNATSEQIAKFEQNLPNDFSGISAVEEEVNKKAELFINEFESKVGKDLIDNLWKRVKDATSYSLNKQLEGGLIDKKTVEDLISRYDYYVPLRGHDTEVAEDRWDYSPDMGTYFVAPLMKAKGRKTRSESPFAYIASMSQSSINSANRNILNQTILRLARKDKTGMLSVNKAWYEKTGEQNGKPVYEVRSPEYNEDPVIYRKNIEEFEVRMAKLAEVGLAVQSGNKLDIGGLFIKRNQAEQHEVHVYQNGTEYVVYINANPAVARAINGSNAKDLHKDLRFFAKVSRQMAANFTTRNPIFVVSNFSRDYIFSSSILPVKESAKYFVQFQRNMIPSADALQRYVRGKADLNKQQDRYLNEYILNGAKTGFSHIVELQKVQKQIERDIKKGEGRNVFRYLLDGLEGMNEFAENLSRLSVYITSREDGRSVPQSVSDAKEVTVNFNRNGTGGFGAAWFRSLYLFINAGIQALSNFAKVAQKNKAKTAMLISSYAMSGFFMPILTSLIGGDDGLDDYLKLSDWERQNNFCIYTGNGFIKIPLPHELRVFHKMGDEIYQSTFGKKDVTQSLLETVLGFSDLVPSNPMGAIQGSWADIMPDATKPFFQLAANRNFTGSRITNEWADPNKPGYLRVRTNKKGEPFAPAFLVKLAETLDNTTGGDGVEKGIISLNPDVINHLMRGYFGGLYNMGMQSLDLSSKTYDWSKSGEFNLKVRETPLKTFYTSESDLQTSSSGLNSKYFNIVDDTQESMRKIKGYKEQVKNGKLSVVEFSKKIENMDVPKTNDLYGRIKQIKKYESALKDLDGKDQKDLEKIISDRKKEVIEVNNKLSE